MTQNTARRILSLLLAMVLLFTSCPTAFAAEAIQAPAAIEEASEPEETEQTQPPAPETEPTDAAAPPDGSAAFEATQPASAPTEPEGPAVLTKPTLPTEPAPETAPTEAVTETEPEQTAPSETVPEETAEETVPEETVEETIPAELPFGLTGMPEGYTPSEEDLAKKQAMIDNGVPEALADLIPGEDYVENQVITSTASAEEAEQIAAAFNGTVVSAGPEFSLIQLTDVSVLDAVTASLDFYLNLPAVSPNYITSLDPIQAYNKELEASMPQEQSWHTWVQENMSNPDPYLKYPDYWDYQWMHDSVDTYAAWGVTTGESWVTVGMVDSGVQANHPDLKGRVTEVDVGCGIGDPVGHGTHVAGIIAAAMNNGTGGAGIAPGVSLRSYRCSNNDGKLNSYAMLQGIIQAADDNVHILNISIGSSIYDPYEEAAIRYALDRKVTVVAASGNNGTNTKEYPASYKGVISVAATDRTDTRAYYSSYGPWVDISAPGDSIISTVPGSTYDSMNGSSMAAAVVSGVAALYTSAMGKRVSPSAMESALKKACTKISDDQMGAGLISASKLFGGKPKAPFLYVTDLGYNSIYNTDYPVPCESAIWFGESETTELGGRPSGDQCDAIVVSINGKNPSVKNGQVVNGFLVEDGAGFSLSDYAGQTITIKAARISGMGIVGQAATLKVKVEKSSNVSHIVINGPECMVAGKSCTLVAEVVAANESFPVDQKVLWSISEVTGTMVNAKINPKTGKLTTPTGKSGYITVRATSETKPSIWAELTISVFHFTPVSKIYLSQTNVFTYVGDGGWLSVDKIVDKQGYVITSWDLFGVSWKSSNPSVATVDQDGHVVGLKKGTATITCTSLDGSGKTAKCKVEVRQPVEFISIFGDYSIAPGSSASFKASVYPSNANAKKVTWGLSGAPSGVSINSSTGKVSVSSRVSLGTTFSIIAYATDYSEVYASHQVEVLRKCGGVYIDAYDGSAGAAGGATWKNGVVSSVHLFSVDLPHTSGTDNSISLGSYAYSEKTWISWSSSNPDVVSVAGGVLTAHKAGKATITLKALDGTGKKATCKVTVTNPVSTMSLDSSVPMMSNTFPHLAYGKSAKHTVNFADTYGVPSSKKVEWDFQVHEFDAYGNHVANLTQYCKSKKLVSINSSGKLTVKRGLQNYWERIDGELEVTVIAAAMDGTGTWASVSYVLIRPTSFVQMDPDYKLGWLESNQYGHAFFYSDQYTPYGEEWYNAFSATSSNPGVVSVESIVPTSTAGLYEINFASGNVSKRSTAKITIKPNDGSKVSCSLSVTVFP